MTVVVESECERNLRELREWLASHPVRPGWTKQMHQARQDRERSLEMWQTKQALIQRAATK